MNTPRNRSAGALRAEAPRFRGDPEKSMSTAHPPRVRHQARDAVTLMAFSAATSVMIAATFLLLAHLPLG